MIMEVEYIEKEISQINMSDVSGLIIPREDDETIADIPEGVRILQMQPDTSLEDMRAELLNEETVFADFIGGIEISVSVLNNIVPKSIHPIEIDENDNSILNPTYQEKYFCMFIEGADTAMLFASKGGTVRDGKCLNCSGSISGEEMKILSTIFGIDNCYTKKYFTKRIKEWVSVNQIDKI